MHSFALPVKVPETSNCQALIAGESASVQLAYLKAAMKGAITPSHQCFLKTVDQIDDIGALLGDLPENTVLFVVQKPLGAGSTPNQYILNLGNVSEDVNNAGNGGINADFLSRGHWQSARIDTSLHHTPSPYIPSEQRTQPQVSATARFHITQFPETIQCVPSKTAAHLKKSTVLLGVNEQTFLGNVPVCEAEQPERIWLMFEVGQNDQFEDIGQLYISGFNFYPLLDNTPNPVDSVWRVRCYTGSIDFEGNYFRLDTRSSVYAQCTHNTNKAVHFGFHNNTVVGMGSARSQEGLLVDFRHLKNNQNVAEVKDNWFAGNIESAIDARLDHGSLMTIENNHIRQAFSEFKQVQYGLELHGPCSSTNEDSSTPSITVKNNFLQSTKTSLVFYGALNVDFSGNQMLAEKFLSIQTITPEGQTVIPSVRLDSSTLPNRWFGNTFSCADLTNISYLKGSLNLVIEPEGRQCHLDL